MIEQYPTFKIFISYIFVYIYCFRKSAYWKKFLYWLREIEAEEDTGIEGILTRLERQRNTDFGINLGKYGYQTQSSSTDERNDWYFRIPIDEGKLV